MKLNSIKQEGIGKILKRIFLPDPTIILAILYGSAAEGRVRPDSDVDVAVARKRPMGFEERLAIYETIGKHVKKSVDVVDLREAGDFFLSQILRTGKVLVCRDPELLVNLAKKVIYFNEDMAPLRNKLIRSQTERFIHG